MIERDIRAFYYLLIASGRLEEGAREALRSFLLSLDCFNICSVMAVIT